MSPQAALESLRVSRQAKDGVKIASTEFSHFSLPLGYSRKILVKDGYSEVLIERNVLQDALGAQAAGSQ
jgi:hypothetical protein